MHASTHIQNLQDRLIARPPLPQYTHTDLFFELDGSLVVHCVCVIVGHTVVDNEFKVITEFINGTVLLPIHLGSHCGEIHWAVYVLQVVWHLFKKIQLDLAFAMKYRDKTDTEQNT